MQIDIHAHSFWFYFAQNVSNCPELIRLLQKSIMQHVIYFLNQNSIFKISNYAVFAESLKIQKRRTFM